MLVHADNGAIHHGILEVRVAPQHGEHALEHATPGPAPEAAEYGVPRAKAAGRSHYGAPARAIHSTASMNRRLSAADRPGSPDLPGISGPSRAHIASLNAKRSIQAPHTPAIMADLGQPCLNVRRP